VLGANWILGLIDARPDNLLLELTFGLTTGCWAFRDLALRTQGPLMAPDAWRDLRRATGFDDVVVLGDPEFDCTGPQAVRLARAPVASDQIPRHVDYGLPDVLELPVKWWVINWS
jgi:hypothetical protein